MSCSPEHFKDLEFMRAYMFKKEIDKLIERCGRDYILNIRTEEPLKKWIENENGDYVIGATLDCYIVAYDSTEWDFNEYTDKTAICLASEDGKEVKREWI